MRKAIIIDKLKLQFPNIKGIQFVDNHIHLGNAAEGGTIDGLSAAEYYPEIEYEFHPYPRVHKKLTQVLEKVGYRTDWQDPGTLIAVEI